MQPGEILVARLPAGRDYRLVQTEGAGVMLLARSPFRDDHRLRDARRQLARRLGGGEQE